MLETIRHAGYSQVAKRNCERGARACIIGTTRSVCSLCRRRRCPAACPCFGCDPCPLNPPQHVGSYFLGPMITAGRPVPQTLVWASHALACPINPGAAAPTPSGTPSIGDGLLGWEEALEGGRGEIETHGRRGPGRPELEYQHSAPGGLPLQAHAQCTCATSMCRRGCSSEG